MISALTASITPRPADGAASSTVFTTAGLPPRERFDYWRALYEGFADLETDAERRLDFHAWSETWRLGPFVMTDAACADLRFTRHARHCARSESDFWVLRVAAASSWVSCSAGRAERVAPGELFLGQTGRPSLTSVPSGRYRLLFLPRDGRRELSLGLSRLPLGRIDRPGSRLLADVLSSLPARLRATPEEALGPLSESLSRMIAACLLSDPAAEPIRVSCAGPLARDRVIGVIQENLGSALLDVNRLCRLAGVSRTVLYRLFEQDGGVATFVRDMRLRMVMADLSDPAQAHMPVARIAERRGLHNAPSFSRAFRRAYGCSPSEARAAAAMGLGPASRPRRLDGADPGSAPRDPLGRS